jgi:hypothetical protein
MSLNHATTPPLTFPCACVQVMQEETQHSLSVSTLLHECCEQRLQIAHRLCEELQLMKC